MADVVQDIRQRSRDDNAIRLATTALLVTLAVLTASQAISALAAAVVIMGIATYMLVRSYRASQDLFHPWAFPTVYVSYVLLAPVLYLGYLGQSIGHIEVSTLYGPTPIVMTLASAGWLAGMVTGHGALRSVHGILGKTSPKAIRDLSSTGTSAMISVGLLTLLLVSLNSDQTYGQGQGQYTMESAIATIQEGLFAVACLLACAGNISRKLVLTPLQIALFIVISGLSAISLGSRSSIIAPCLIVLWFWGQRHRLRVAPVLAAIALIVLMFNWIGDSRAPTGVTADASNVWERSLIDTSSPYQVTSILTTILPAQREYYGGVTYGATLRGLGPGFLTSSTNDARQTAALEFRRLSGAGINEGLGFSLPSEAYMNFGKAGAFLISFLVALFGARSYGWLTSDLGRAKAYVYVIFVTAVPYGIRSDSLAQAKVVLYPIAILGVAMVLFKRTRRCPDNV